jgi:hypothetical protein
VGEGKEERVDPELDDLLFAPLQLGFEGAFDGRRKSKATVPPALTSFIRS